MIMIKYTREYLTGMYAGSSFPITVTRSTLRAARTLVQQVNTGRPRKCKRTGYKLLDHSAELVH